MAAKQNGNSAVAEVETPVEGDKAKRNPIDMPAFARQYMAAQKAGQTKEDLMTTTGLSEQTLTNRISALKKLFANLPPLTRKSSSPKFDVSALAKELGLNVATPTAPAAQG